MYKWCWSQINEFFLAPHNKTKNDFQTNLKMKDTIHIGYQLWKILKQQPKYDNNNQDKDINPNKLVYNPNIIH